MRRPALPPAPLRRGLLLLGLLAAAAGVYLFVWSFDIRTDYFRGDPLLLWLTGRQGIDPGRVFFEQGEYDVNAAAIHLMYVGGGVFFAGACVALASITTRRRPPARTSA